MHNTFEATFNFYLVAGCQDDYQDGYITWLNPLYNINILHIILCLTQGFSFSWFSFLICRDNQKTVDSFIVICRCIAKHTN